MAARLRGVRLGAGKATAWTCDLTHDYLSIQCGLSELTLDRHAGRDQSGGSISSTLIMNWAVCSTVSRAARLARM